MEWVLRSPQLHSTFSNLGFAHSDGYHVNENCNAALETILHNILTEDKFLRTHRRSISFGQNIKKDLIPLLIHAKEEKTIELLIRILVNLTIPIECLLSVDVISRNDFGRHTIFELNNLLSATKVAFTDHRATKVVIDFLRKNIEFEQKAKLSLDQCTNISNSLLLLRNILHIPEECSGQGPNYSGPPTHAVQNQILWNIFSQSIDKVLIKLMIVPDANKWAVTMVQLIALLYKDQHVATLHQFLNSWLETSMSESSEDNESNTSPPDRGSQNSSPMLTSDPISDSSDSESSSKFNDEPNYCNKVWDVTSLNNRHENGNKAFPAPSEKDPEAGKQEQYNCAGVTSDDTMKFIDNEMETSCYSGENSGEVRFSSKTGKKTELSENSDCGYNTQIENQESISTSSNEDELLGKKPVHQKPHNPKQRINTKVRSAGVTAQDRKRTKIVKRGKTNIINVQGLSHKTPTDDDISNVLKEFTIDFLLKGYNSLVQTLHCQILTNLQLEIDTSHFFWLVTYFLKFATQIELDLEHVSSVLSFEIVSYLTAEGVNLCEQFELAIKLDGNDLKPSIRRLHLVVTAIREIIQTIEVYKKFPHICKDDQEKLVELQINMCETEELRSLLVLLLRQYNPKYHTKQYLQDLIVTNHILLVFLDNGMNLAEYHGSANMVDHIQQFATSGMMYNYGLLLEDYSTNGEFVNDCLFTLMHHVGGELGSLITLFQPNILKTFTSIWKSEFEICEDWSDLIEYVINTFIKKPHTLQSTATFHLDTENFDDDKVGSELEVTLPTQAEGAAAVSDASPPKRKSCNSIASSTSKEKWTNEEISLLSWNYIQCSSKTDVIGEIIKLFNEDVLIKSRDSVIKQLFKLNVINKNEFEKLVKEESDRNTNALQANKDMRDDEIVKICDQLALDGKSAFLVWVQKILLETCFAKIYIGKKARINMREGLATEMQLLMLKKCNDLSPVCYHSLLVGQSVPLVPWNCKQAAICKDLKFLQLLHKLGFHMPVDSGKVFIRIPHFWTADFLYDVAEKISPINKSKLKFSISDIFDTGIANSKQQESLVLSAHLTNNITMIETSDEIFQINKPKQPVVANFTPTPRSSLNSEPAEVDTQNWLEVVQQSQEYKITLNMESRMIEDEEDAPPPAASPDDEQLPDAEYFHSLCETASVASDLTRMYVSDEDEKSEVMLPPVIKANTCMDERSQCDSDNVGKRPRVEFFTTF